MEKGFRRGRLIVESVVIVGSILLAFWIDAAWELRGQAAERTALFRALQEDFEGYEDVLAQRIFHSREDSVAAERILAVTGTDGSAMTSSELAAHLEELWGGGLIDLPRGATAALEDARRDLIDSPELLEALLAWQQEVDGVARGDEYLVWASNRLTDFTYARWPNRALSFLSAETRFPRNPEVLLSSVEFESLVYERGVASVFLLGRLQRMEERRRHVGELLTRELTGGPY